MIEFFKRHIHKYVSEKKGATAVEFAMISVAFLSMIVGIMEGGRMVWMMNGVRYAIEDTSRFASLNPDRPNAEYQTYAESRMTAMMLPADSLNVASQTTTSNGIEFVEISATYNITPMVASFLSDHIGTVSVDSTSRKPVIE